jgi:hypothetical protein
MRVEFALAAFVALSLGGSSLAQSHEDATFSTAKLGTNVMTTDLAASGLRRVTSKAANGNLKTAGRYDQTKVQFVPQATASEFAVRYAHVGRGRSQVAHASGHNPKRP